MKRQGREARRWLEQAILMGDLSEFRRIFTPERMERIASDGRRGL